MNRIYKTLWSVATQSWQAVPETATTAGKKTKSFTGGIVASVALGFALSGVAHGQSPPVANQLPTGGSVARGTATISQTATAQAAAMTVNQTSQSAVVNWNTFNLGSSASVNFVQPNSQAVTLNRVNDSNPSQIFGRITANGQVFLSNANGVYFAPGSSVDVGSFTATTHSISDDNFMSGKYVFERNGAIGKIINKGNINAALGGYVALLAPEVQNAGVVVARAGTVAMAAGEMITLTVDTAGSLAGILTTPSTIASLIENKQAVQAPDGQIILSAVAMNKLQAGVIKNSGSLEANSLVNKGGKIVLEGDEITLDRNSKIEAKGASGGGTVLVGGDWQGSGDVRQATKVTMEADATIDASATNNGDGGKVVLWSDVHNADSQTSVYGGIDARAGTQGGNGGKIETSGHVVDIVGARVNAGSDRGQGGLWLLDPYSYVVTSAEATTIKNSLDLGTSFTLDTANSSSAGVSGTSGTGTITISSAINKSAGGAATLTMNAASDITLNAQITSTSGALGVNMTAGGSIAGAGNLSLNGGTATFNQATAGGGYSGVLSGTGTSLVKSGAGELSLSGANSYTGTTTLLGGTLTLSNANAIPTSNTGTITFGGGVLQFTSTNMYDYSQNFSSAANQQYLISTSTGATVTFASNLNGSNAILQKSGLGVLKLTGSNSFTSVTQLMAGYLELGSPNAIGTIGTISLMGGVIRFTSANTTDYSPRFNNAAANQKYYFDTNGQTVTFATGLTSQGTAANNTQLAKYGAAGGTLILSGASTYTGAIALNTNSGTLLINGAGSLGSAGIYAGNIMVGANTTFQYASTTAQTLSGVISAGGNLVDSGTGTLTLSGINTYTGNISISLGSTLLVSGAGKLGSGTYAGSILNNGTFQYGSSAAQTLSGVISGSGELIDSGTGTLTLSGVNTYTGSTSISSGSTLGVSGVGKLGSGTYAGDITNNGTFQYGSSAAQTLSGVISGTGNLTDSGTGTLTLTGLNSYTGNTSISSGSTLFVGGTGKLGLGTYAGGVANSGTFQYGSSVAQTLSGVISGTGNLTDSGTGTLSLSGLNSYTGNTSISNGSTLVISGAGKLGSGTYAGNITNNGTFTYSSSSDQLLSGIISGSGTLIKDTDNTSTLTLSGANTYTGVTTLNNGVLRLASNSALGDTVGGTSVSSAATLELSGSASPGGLSIGAEPLTLADGAALHNIAGANTYAGAMTLNGNATVTIDTGTSLNYTGAVGAVPTLKRLTLNSDGNLTFGADLTGGLNATYLKTGSGTLSMTAGSTLPTVTQLYAGLYDGAGNYSSEYGSTPSLSVGFFTDVAGTTSVNGATASGTATWSGTLPTASSNVGAYSVTYASGLTLSNPYLYVLMGATNAKNWTVTPKALTVTGATIANKTYDGTNTATFTGGALSGVVGSDNVILTQAGTFASPNAGTGIAVTTADTLGGTAAGNYTLTQPRGLSADITPKALTITANNASKTYDGQAYTGGNGVSFNGFVNNETSAALNGTLSYSGNSQGAVNAGTYAVSPTGYTSSNYAISYANGVLTVSPLSVALTGTMNYSGLASINTSDTSSSLSASNMVSNDVVVVTGTATLAAASAGTQSITGVNGLTLSNSNYTLTGASGSVNVVATSAINVTVLNNTDVSALIGSQLAGLTASQMGSFSASQLTVFSSQQLAALSPSQLTGLTPVQLGSLTSTQLQGMTAVQMAALSATQLNGLSAMQFASLSNAQLQAMSGTQVNALLASQISALSPAQISALTGNAATALNVQQILALSPAQMAAMNPSQMAYLSVADINALSNAQLASLTNAHLQSLSGPQVNALLPWQLSSLSPAQISALTANASRPLNAQQVFALVPAQIAAMSPTQVAHLTAADLGALSESQVQSLSAAQLAVVIPANLAALSPEQIVALSLAQVDSLSGEQLAAFTPTQVASLTTAQLGSFTAVQLAAIGIYPNAATTNSGEPSAPATAIAQAAVPSLAPALPPVAEMSGAQIRSLTSEQLNMLSKNQLANFNSAQLQALTVAQLSQLTAEQVGSLSKSQLSVMSQTQLQALPVSVTQVNAPLITSASATASAQAGVLAVTFIQGNESKPLAKGVAFEQSADTVALQSTTAPVSALVDRVTFTAKMTTFLVTASNGEMVEFQGGLVNNRMVIVASTTQAKSIVRDETNVVLAAAIYSLGKDSRIMLAQLDGVVIDLR